MAIFSFRLTAAAAASFSVPPYPTCRHRSSSFCRAAGGGGLLPITVAGDPPTFVSTPGHRNVAVGDLHGDLYQTRAALVMAGVLSSESDCHVWTGGQTVRRYEYDEMNSKK